MLLGGALALAAAPLAAQADEPMRLDSAQLDAVTAAAAAGVTVSGDAFAFGTLFSQSTTAFQAQGESSPAFSSGSASITNFALGFGGTGANTPVADTNAQVDFALGDRVYTREFKRDGAGRGYAWSYSAAFAFVFSSEFPI